MRASGLLRRVQLERKTTPLWNPTIVSLSLNTQTASIDFQQRFRSGVAESLSKRKLIFPDDVVLPDSLSSNESNENKIRSSYFP